MDDDNSDHKEKVKNHKINSSSGNEMMMVMMTVVVVVKKKKKHILNGFPSADRSTHQQVIFLHKVLFLFNVIPIVHVEFSKSSGTLSQRPEQPSEIWWAT